MITTPVAAPTLPTRWAGALSFDEANLQTVDVPLNVTIQAGAAGFLW